LDNGRQKAGNFQLKKKGKATCSPQERRSDKERWHRGGQTIRFVWKMVNPTWTSSY